MVSLLALGLASTVVPTGALHSNHDGDDLDHGVKQAFVLRPEDPTLAEFGPSQTFYYVLEGNDSVVFVHAESSDADLLLQVEDLGADDLTVHEDDNSGGGTTPFLRLEVRDGLELEIRVAAKGALDGTVDGRVQVFEAQETPETRLAAAEARAVVDVVREHAKLGEFDAARSTLSAALRTMLASDRAAQSDAVSRTAFFLAFEADSLGDLESARLGWEHAERFRLQCLPPDDLDLRAVRTNLSATFLALGDRTRAREYAERVLASAERALPERDPELQAARSNLAAILRDEGQIERARSMLEQVVEVLSKDLPPQASRLYGARLNLAGILLRQGEVSASRTLAAEVVDALSQHLPEEHPHLQAARLALANAMHLDGELGAARAHFEWLLEVRTRSLNSDHPHVQLARQNLAESLRATGDLLGARLLQEQVLEARARLLSPGDPELLAARGNLAITMREQGDLAGARALQEHVLDSRERVSDPDDVLLQLSRLDLAVTKKLGGDLTGARELEEQVFEIFERTWPQAHRYSHWVRSNLAVTHKLSGDLEAARVLEEQALATFSEVLPSDHPSLQSTRNNLAVTRAGLGDAIGSQELGRELATGILRAAQGVAGRSLRDVDVEMARHGQWADFALSLAGGLGRFETDSEAEVLAFTACEALRGMSTALARLLRRTVLEPEAAQLREELIRAQKRMSASLASLDERFEFVEVVRERERLERALSRLQADQDADFARAAHPTAIAAALRPGEVGLSFWHYAARTFADDGTQELQATPSYLLWLVRPEGALRRFELGTAAEIDEAIERWQRSIGAPEREVSSRVTRDAHRELGADLRDRLLGPVLDELEGVRRIWIVPARAVHQVPLDALPFEEGVLGDRFEVAHLAALSEREALMDPQENPSVSRLLAVGGVRYDLPTEDSPRGVREEDGDRSSNVGASIYALRSPNATTGCEFRFGALSWTRAEAANVQEYFHQCFEGREFEASLLTGKDAGRARFEELAPSARFLHLATHGWFAPEAVPSSNDEAPIDQKLGLGRFTERRAQVRGMAPSLLCGLAFAGANGEADRDGRVRGVMTAAELRALDLSRCELAVLSACETNVGAARGGQGIASLQQALQVAGVRTSITSLWRVPDAVTQELMTEFYRRVWMLGEPKGKALWAAKRMIREQVDVSGRPTYTPYHWAGWVLSGDPD